MFNVVLNNSRRLAKFSEKKSDNYLFRTTNAVGLLMNKLCPTQNPESSRPYLLA